MLAMVNNQAMLKLLHRHLAILARLSKQMKSNQVHLGVKISTSVRSEAVEVPITRLLPMTTSIKLIRRLKTRQKLQPLNHQMITRPSNLTLLKSNHQLSSLKTLTISCTRTTLLMVVKSLEDHPVDQTPKTPCSTFTMTGMIVVMMTCLVNVQVAQKLVKCGKMFQETEWMKKIDVSSKSCQRVSQQEKRMKMILTVASLWKGMN